MLLVVADAKLKVQISCANIQVRGALRKHAHAMYRKSFGSKNEKFTGKILIFFLFLLKTWIVGTR